MTTAIDPLQQPAVDQLESEVRTINQQIDGLYLQFVTLQRNFLQRIDTLKAQRDAMLRRLYQLTGDATPPAPTATPAMPAGPAGDTGQVGWMGGEAER